MCEACGCIPCDACGVPLENGTCVGCGEKSDSCTCELFEEELAYDEEEELEDEDLEEEEEDEDEDEDEEDEEEFEDDDEDLDDDDEEDW